MSRIAVILMVSMSLLAGAPVLADDLTGADRFLCSVSSVVFCWEDGTCDAGSAADLNIPQFIVVDLGQKRLSTTKASGLDRSTTIASIQRDADTIVLQGYENGRAFSYVIAEKTGMSSAAILAGDRSVSGFGACTPLTSDK